MVKVGGRKGKERASIGAEEGTNTEINSGGDSVQLKDFHLGSGLLGDEEGAFDGLPLGPRLGSAFGINENPRRSSAWTLAWRHSRPTRIKTHQDGLCVESMRRDRRDLQPAKTDGESSSPCRRRKNCGADI